MKDFLGEGLVFAAADLLWASKGDDVRWASFDPDLQLSELKPKTVSLVRVV